MRAKTRKQSFILIWLCTVIFFLIFVAGSFSVKAEMESGETDTIMESLDANTNEEENEETEEPEILDGLCIDSESGQIAYYKNGEIDSSYTGFEKLADGSDDSWYYVESGVVTGTKNDVILEILNGIKGWYLIKESRFTEETTVAHNNNGWWYVKDGKVDFDYYGFAKNENGWWYLEKSKVTFQKNDILFGKANNELEGEPEDGWWLIRNSQLVNETTIEKNVNGWWYVKDGKVNFSYTGLAHNSNGWWYVKNGKVDFSCNSVEQNEYGWWYIKNGKVDFSYIGLAQNVNGWWYIKGGQVDFTYNGLAYYKGNWYYMEDGKLNWNYNGIVSIPGYRKSYNVKNGRVSGGLIPPTAELAQKADKILQSLGYDLDKADQDLHKAFNWCVMSYQVYTTGGDKGTAYYATYGMNNHRGNCYCMAASFVVLARELGYEAYEISGYIAGTYIHSWSEVKIGNTFYVFDPDFVVDQGRNGYQIYYGQSGTWRYTDYYTMYN